MGFMGGLGVKGQHFPLTLLVVLTTLTEYRVSVINLCRHMKQKLQTSF